MPIGMPYVTIYLLAIAMFALSATTCQKFAIEMCMTLTLTFRIGQCQIKCANGKPYETLHLLAIAMFALSVTVC